MTRQTKDVMEKRHSVQCANCGTTMVCMNKYLVFENEDKAYIWYICPRRKKSKEAGCGHKTIVEIRRDAIASRAAQLDFGFRLKGEVRVTDKVAMVIQENLETFETWLQRNKDKFKDKKIELIIQLIKNKGTR